jgi:AraC-like DNA-binding protein
MKLYIKNMVCIRCKMVVKSELHNLGLDHAIVELGEVEILDSMSSEQRDKLDMALRKSGLELMDSKRSILIEKIKSAVIEMVHYSDELPHVKISEYLSQKLDYDYTYLSNIFSEVQSTTIEQFVIHHKIERVKELLVYDDLNLTEIAYLMHYSSVAHLSNQFKRITGLTPTHFKQLKHKRRIGLDDV